VPESKGYAAPVVTPLNSALWAYGQTFLLAPLALLLMAAFALVSACWRLRKVRPRDAIDAVLLSGLGLALIGLSIVLAGIDMRYTVPLLVVVPPAAVLAWYRLRGEPVPDGPVGDGESRQVGAAGA
jgi:hypothetical protein